MACADNAEFLLVYVSCTAQVVKDNTLVLFMKGTPDLPQCGFSRAVVQILEVQGVEPSKIKAFNCLEDQELREGIKEYRSVRLLRSRVPAPRAVRPTRLNIICVIITVLCSSWPTIPQVYLKGEFIGGCDIMLQMHQSGELEKMLAEAKLVEPEPASA